MKAFPNKTGTILSRFYRVEITYITVDLTRDGRYAGESGYDLKKMFKLAFDRILPHTKIQLAKRKPEYEVESYFVKG